MTVQQQRHLMQVRRVSRGNGMRIRNCRIMRMMGYSGSIKSKRIKSYSLALCTGSAMIPRQTVEEAEVVRMAEEQLPWAKWRYVIRLDD